MFFRVSDLTYVGTKEGWLYLVCIMDVSSSRILGHAMGETMDTQGVHRRSQPGQSRLRQSMLGRDDLFL
jgi:transposase InsO family protein